MKHLSIIGSRPQYPKVLDLKNHIVVDTSQHYSPNMSKAIMKDMKVKPKYFLKTQDLGVMINKAQEVIKKEEPDMVIVYGDTRSTLAGALAAKFSGKMLAHVEAGCRSGDMLQPEEVIRIIVDRISDYKFCTSIKTRNNLYNEGNVKDVYVVGDTMFDAMNKTWPIPKSKDAKTYIYMTLHRPALVDNKDALKGIFEALGASGEKIVFPCHPRTRKNLTGIKIPKNVKLIEPLPIKKNHHLMANAKKVITDSGGVQREAYWFGVPCIIPRDVTEWPELTESGWAILTGYSQERLLDAIKNFQPDPVKNKRELPEFGSKKRIADILQ